MRIRLVILAGAGVAMQLSATRRNSKGAVMMGETEAESGFFRKTRAPSVEMAFLLGAKKKAGAEACGNCGILLVGRKAMIGDAAQYQELVTLYGSYGDDELVALGRGMGDLTEMAQEALKGELTRRGLRIAAMAEPVESRVLSEDDLADLRSYAESAPAECIFDFENERAVTAAYYALTAEGIEAIVVSRGARSDRRGPRVVVTPKDAERAAAILLQPLAEDVRAATEAAFAGFALPKCPACGRTETLLESVDPVNQWRCDNCDHTWLEESVSSSD